MLTPEQTQELKEILMSTMFERGSAKIQTLVYDPAKLDRPFGIELELERKHLMMDIYNVYTKIEGFYKKPFLAVTWNPRGECVIHLTD